MSVEFITFGSHANYVEAARRLVTQANELQVFNKTTMYTGTDLQADTAFWAKHGQFLMQNARGFGFWIWKSYLIKKNMEKMKDGDIILYSDCGCEIDVKERDYMVECIERVKVDKHIGTNTYQPEKLWNKMDLVLKFDALTDEMMDTQQRQATVVMMYVCPEMRKFVDEWYNICCDYHLVDNSPSVARNLSCFREHRHDQAIYSLLVKRGAPYSELLLDKACIKIARNKTGYRQY